MASCKFNPGINSVNPYVILNVTQQSQNVANNTTTLRYELLLYRPSKISSSANKAYSIQIDNKTIKSGTTLIGGSGTKSIINGTYTVTHNSNGERSVQFGFSLAFDIKWNVGHIGTGKASDTMKLTTIPRATTPTLNPSSLYLGGTINISLPRASSSFTHNLSWKFGNLSGTIGNGIATSASLRTESSWASQIPNGSSGVGYIYCDTYNGGTKIGAKTVSFTANISTGMEPVINNVNISEAVSGIYNKFYYCDTYNGGTKIGAKTVSFTANISTGMEPVINNVNISEAVSGIYNKFYGYLQNNSKLAVNISASGAQGATIKSYKTTICGISYNGQSFTSATISKSGNVEVSVSVTDSRGLSATRTYNVNVLPYEAPKINLFSVDRADYNYNLSSVGTYASIRIGYEISNVSGRNNNSYRIEYRESGSYSWTTITSGSGYAATDRQIQGGNILVGAYTYEVRLTVTDYFGSVESTVEVPTTATLFNINKEGTSICFGGVSNRAEERCFDFEYPICVKDSVMPYVDSYAQIGDINSPFGCGYFSDVYINGINGKSHLQQRQLWTSTWFMNASQTAYLSEPISEQQHGILLFFQAYENGSIQEYWHNVYFVPKSIVKLKPGVGHSFHMVGGSDYGGEGRKYLYIYDDKIVGNQHNEGSGTKNGITYANNKFVLKYVYGI